MPIHVCNAVVFSSSSSLGCTWKGTDPASETHRIGVVRDSVADMQQGSSEGRTTYPPPRHEVQTVIREGESSLDYTRLCL